MGHFEGRAGGRHRGAPAGGSTHTHPPPPTVAPPAPLQYLRWYVDGRLVYEANQQALVAQTNGTGAWVR